MPSPNGNFENTDLNSLPGQQSLEYGNNQHNSNSNDIFRRPQQGELNENMMEESMEKQTIGNEKPNQAKSVTLRRPQAPVLNSNTKPASSSASGDGSLDPKTTVLLWQLFFASNPLQAGGMFKAQQLLSILSDHLTKPEKKAEDFLSGAVNGKKQVLANYDPRM